MQQNGQPSQCLVTMTKGTQTVGMHRTAGNGQTSFIIDVEPGQILTAAAVDGAGRTGTGTLTV